EVCVSQGNWTRARHRQGDRGSTPGTDQRHQCPRQGNDLHAHSSKGRRESSPLELLQDRGPTRNVRMTMQLPRFVRLFAVIVLVTACTTGQQRLAQPSPGPVEGATTIAQSAQEASAGRFGVADKLLADYSAR